MTKPLTMDRLAALRSLFADVKHGTVAITQHDNGVDCDVLVDGVAVARCDLATAQFVAGAWVAFPALLAMADPRWVKVDALLMRAIREACVTGKPDLFADARSNERLMPDRLYQPGALRSDADRR